jgi:hypothetical protein
VLILLGVESLLEKWRRSFALIPFSIYIQLVIRWVNNLTPEEEI